MRIYIVTDNSKLTPFKDTKNDSPEMISYKDLKKKYSLVYPESIVYFDLSSKTEAEQKKIFRTYTVRKDLRYGILDPKSECEDPACFFHAGFSDYLGKNIIKKGVSVKRLPGIEMFTGIDKKSSEEKKLSMKYTPVTGGWKEVKTGSEYTFFFIFIQLDNQKELKAYFSGNTFPVFCRKFHDIIERKMGAIGGKIWMWEDFGGLILIPFDGKKENNIIELIFRLYLDKMFIYADEMLLDEIILSFKTVLHIGSTVYKNRGSTGTVIADSVNSIYHIGYKFSDKDSFLITEEIQEFVPQFLSGFFSEAGEYEGRKLLKMKRFL